MLCRVSAKGVGGQELLGITKELEFVDWDDEMGCAPHGTVGAVTGAGNYTWRSFGLPTDTSAVASPVVDNGVHACLVRTLANTEKIDL